MDKIELAKEILEAREHIDNLSNSAGNYLERAQVISVVVVKIELLEKAEQLAQVVIDETISLTPRGERMPQTPEQFTYLADKYENALLEEKEENSRLRAKLNELDQKYSKAKQEQKEKNIKIIQAHLFTYENLLSGETIRAKAEVCRILIKEIRERE